MNLPKPLAIRTAKADFDPASLRTPTTLSNLLHKIGHEIGNPLTSIISLAAIIDRFPATSIEETDKKRSLYAESIAREAWKISSITEKLVLLFSEKQGFSTPCKVTQCVQQAAAKLRTRFNFDDSILTFAIDEIENLTACIDKDQFILLLMELISNGESAAINCQKEIVDLQNFFPNIKVTGRTNGQWTEIKISSTSTTPCPFELSQVFEPFVSGDPEHKKLGIGLPMVAAIVKRAGGSLEVHEEQRSAEEFIFSVVIALPNVEGSQSSKETSDRTSSSSTLSNSAPKNRTYTVLIVEDQAAVATAIAKLLETEALLEFKTAPICLSGEEAIEYIQSRAPVDAVLCDLNLNSISGRFILETFLAHYPQGNQKFAFITGDKSRPETQNYLKSSGCHYLHKPFETAELVSLVKKLVAAQISRPL